MEATGGAPPSEDGSWTRDCRMVPLQEADSRATCTGQQPQEGSLPPAVSFGGVGGTLPPHRQPIFHSVAMSNVPCTSTKTLEQPAMNPGGSLGGATVQTEPAEGTSVQSWLILQHRQMQQQLYYDGQQMVQQHLHQQRSQVLQQGTHGESPPVNIGEVSHWQNSMEYPPEKPAGFGYGSPCMMPSQAPPQYTVSSMPSAPFATEAHLTGQPQLAAWQTSNTAQRETLSPPPTSASAPYSFGVCLSNPQSPPGGLRGGPEAPRATEPWYSMQQQQPVGNLQAPPAMFPPVGGPSAPLLKAEGKSSRACKGGGSRRRGDPGTEGGVPSGCSSSTRPAKFFKQHSPAKGALKSRGKTTASQGVGVEEAGTKDTSNGSAVCPASGQAPLGTQASGTSKPSSGSVDAGEGNNAAPRANARPRTVRPSEVMAKMYFHRKKEAWRAELLIEGTKKQKSFSCRLYGYERARLMCEWARKFVLRTSRLPTDEETCTSLASLMKEPLPTHVPTAMPCTECPGAPGGPQRSFLSSGDAQGAHSSKIKNPAVSVQQQQQPEVSAALNAGNASTREVNHGTSASSPPGAKCPLEQQPTTSGMCKKRKEPAKSGETTTKVRKGGEAQIGATAKKGQGSRSAVEVHNDPTFMGPRQMSRTDLLVAGSGGKAAGPTECKGEATQHVLSPYISFISSDSPAAPYTNPLANCGNVELQELSAEHGPPLSQEVGTRPGILQDELQAKAAELCPRDSEANGTDGTNPWFEELEQLKKISRPKGGRAKRFNVGKKPFSGVRGIYFQQGLWKVKYRGEQEEAMKLFPYSPGDEKDMKSQFELARSFLRQVIDKGRQLHDSDGEGLSEDEPAWLVRSNSSSKWACKKEQSTVSSKTEQPPRPKSPTAQPVRRRAPTSSKASRPDATNDLSRVPLPGAAVECQSNGVVRPYFSHGSPLQQDGAQLPPGLPVSAPGAAYAPEGPVDSRSWIQGSAVERASAEPPEEETCGQQLRGGAEAIAQWGSLTEPGEGETLTNRPPELRLPLMPCRGVFTTGDSPMYQRPSPKEKSPFSHEGSTGFFSAVTTATDEALPVASWNVNEGTTTVAGASHSKTSNGHYATNYFCCQPFNAPAEDRGSVVSSGVSHSSEAAQLVALPTNRNLHEPDLGLPQGEFLQHMHLGPSGGVPPSSPYSACGNAVATPMTLLQPFEGTPKNSESFLQFRPFLGQQTGQLETSLGEELLSGAGYACEFSNAMDSRHSTAQQMRADVPLLPSTSVRGIALVEHDEAAAGSARPSHCDSQASPWALASPLTLCRPKEEARARGAGAPEKAEPLRQSVPANFSGEMLPSRRPAALPWLVVKPREEEEKALTPLAAKASGYLLQGAPMGCACNQYHAN